MQPRYIGEHHESDVNTLSTGDVRVTDVSAKRHAAPHLEPYLAVENVLDETYAVGRSRVDTAGLPRLVHGGFRLNL